MTVNENNFIFQLKKRNEKALKYIISAYGGIVYSIISKHLYPFNNMFEECLNDVYMSVWDNIVYFDSSKGTFKNWIGAIAKYKSINYKKKYLNTLKEFNYESLNISNTESIDKNLLEMELSKEIDELLENLNESDKALFKKHYINNEDIKQLAKETGIKKSAIYNRLSRGRKKLKNILLKESNSSNTPKCKEVIK